ncbi:MAG: hypothetical protein U0002_08795 [Thermoanaerobaculia bacterium]
MVDGHLTEEELRQLRLGGTGNEPLLRRLLDHHLEVCPACRAQAKSQSDAPAAVVPAGLAAVVESAITLSAHRAVALAQLESRAKEELAELLALPAAYRRLKLGRALSRFRNPALVDLLLERSREQASADPYEAFELADCACAVALRLPHEAVGRTWAMTSLARSHAYRGNALRSLGDLRRAEAALDFARGIFHDEGNGDPLTEAEILHLTGSLRLDQRRFAEAGAVLEAAQAIYSRVGERTLVSRMLVKRAAVLSEAGEPEKAVGLVEEALLYLDAEGEPKLYLAAEHNLTDYLVSVGRTAEAAARLERNRRLYDRFPDPWTQLRRKWIAARIAAASGRLKRAEEGFATTRAGFLAEGLAFHAALVGLDLAKIYVSRGRWAAVQELAEEIVPVLAAQGIQAEALEALLSFREAAEQEAVTEAMVGELAVSIRRASYLPFEQAA